MCMHAWVEVSRSAVEQNVGVLRAALSKQTGLFAVVKANAYGHGLSEMVQALAGQVDGLAVAHGHEALDVRRLGYTGRLLAMTSLGSGDALIAELLRADVECVVHDLPGLERLQTIAQSIDVRARVHGKIDSGASRIGVLPSEVSAFWSALQAASHLDPVALFSHFSDSEDPECMYTQTQIDQFEASLRAIEERSLERHMACSAAVFTAPHAQFDAVRAGLMVYGMWPSEEVRHVVQRAHPEWELRPVLTWKTRVLQRKSLPKGTAVSYGRTHTTRRPTELAVLPVGYADGYDRLLSNRGEVLIRGQRCPILGRVCMNLTMVDVTDVPGVCTGDEVVLLGAQGDDRVFARELAAWTQTINYEITTRISAALPRHLVV